MTQPDFCKRKAHLMETYTYPAGLETNDLRRIKQDDDGVVWL